jgi:hypothetical protein
MVSYDLKCRDFWSRFADECQTFSQLQSKNRHGLAPMGPPGASTTLHHHLLDPFRGYPMVWRQLIWFHMTTNAVTFGQDLLMSAKL